VQQLGERFDARLVGHDDVHQDYVRFQLARLQDRLAAVTSFARRLDITFPLKQKTDARANHGMIVDDEKRGSGSPHPAR
jgi:hypothetical protein